jgi:hypothetical protein
MNSYVTTQRTSKTIKIAQVIGWLAFFVSIFMVFGDDAGGGTLFFASILWLLVTRCAKWWTNG